MILVRNSGEHSPGPAGDSQGAGGGGLIKLNVIYPVVISPLTNEIKTYNNTIIGLIPRWWNDISGPSDNSQAADPDADHTLSCSPGGGAEANGRWGAQQQEMMLPGVISMTCVGVEYYHGGRSPYSVEWGYNWLVSQQRQIKPTDVFIANSGWLKALTALLNAERQNAAPWDKTIDVADRHHWVLGANGLGFAYSAEEFTGYADGGDVDFTVIPWSKLASYLRKDGIVPQKYWTVGTSD